MINSKESLLETAPAAFSVTVWLEHMSQRNSANEFSLIKQACEITENASTIEIAAILAELNLDYETLIAAILYTPIKQETISLEQVEKLFSVSISHLLKGVVRMDTLRDLQNKTGNTRSQEQMDSLRKMLVAMVDDVRVVLIKLAERLHALRYAYQLPEHQCKAISREVRDIYAPLANRLGVWQLKWELEDLTFRYLQPETYASLVIAVKNRRSERDKLITKAITKLRHELTEAGLVKFDISGRAKHIYSIYKKMERKGVDYVEIYDANAIRVLVPTVEDCYLVLSIVHNVWQQIPKEFDDYITHPKPNGYRSIHTAVIGPGKDNLEVQIRTYAMHQESELGVAAHWAYKEGKAQKPAQLDKIAWLRQVLDWQKELIKPEPSLQNGELFDNHIYVFSPAGDVIDLPKGATPLDFAYTIHSQIGHRCRGAKINGNIVPLTYPLQTSDQVEILTAKQPNPSRDWLNPHAGYLATPRARATVQHWFKLQDYDRHVIDGHELLNKELQRTAIHALNLDALAAKLHYNNTKDMFAALGAGRLRLSQLDNAILQLKPQTATPEPTADIFTKSLTKKTTTAKSAVNISGINDLLSHLASCCKPVPGDSIVGYITQGHGISIHRQDCPNILGLQNEQRLIEVDWNALIEYKYPVDLQIIVQDRYGLLRDLTTTLSAEKININAMATSTGKTELSAKINLTIEVKDTNQLEHIIQRINQLPHVIEVKRVH